jgi:V8-like Glu-specific endopeptidase
LSGALWTIGVAFVLVLASSAQAIYIRNDKSVSDYNGIAGKTPFAPTGYLADKDWGIAFSSATLIAPDKVLTAAHVVDENGDLKIDDPLQVKRIVFGTQKNVPDLLVPNIASVAINPAYKGGLAGYDLAILTLRNRITTIAPARLSSFKAVGMRGAMIGYGYQGTGTRDGLSGANDKLAAFNLVSAYADNTYLTDFDSPSSNKSTYNPITPLTYEGTTAPGDSGGPLYADFGNGSWKIVGVLNGGYNEKGPDSHYGDISVYAALNNPGNVSFLQSQGFTITSTRSITSYDSTTSSNLRDLPVPEPTAAFISFLPVAGLLLARRRVRQTV